MRMLTTLALALVCAGSMVGQSEGIFPFDYRLVELDNGFKAYLIQAGAPGQIAYVSIVRTGSRDEVEAAWSWIEPVIDAWNEQREPPKSYTASTWGPSASIALIERDGRTWYEDAA